MISIRGTEFFTFEEDAWYRNPDGTQHKITENDKVVGLLFDYIAEFYPEAMECLQAKYARCQANIVYFRYRVVVAFIKCNFGEIDYSKPDIGHDGTMHFEHVKCPLRGECSMENIVCHPKFNSKISDAELRVLLPLYRGIGKEVIAEQLCLSLHTVNNHIRNAFQRIGVHEKAEFIAYANKHTLFPAE